MCLAMDNMYSCKYVLSMVYPLFLLLQRFYCCFALLLALSVTTMLTMTSQQEGHYNLKNSKHTHTHTHTHTTFIIRCTSFSGTHTLALEVSLSAVVNQIQFCWGFIFYTADCTQPSLLHSNHTHSLNGFTCSLTRSR